MRTRLSLSLCATLVLLSVLSPAIAQGQSEAVCARPVVVEAGDTLTGLANAYLDDPLAFTRIIAATNAAATADNSFDPIDDEGRIVIGWKLCLEAPVGPVPAATPVSTPVATGAPSSLSEGGPAAATSSATNKGATDSKASADKSARRTSINCGSRVRP